MFTRILSLGFCEKYDSSNQTHTFHPYKIRQYFNNTLFHFKINSGKKEDFVVDNYQFRSYDSYSFKLTPSGCYFNPGEVQCRFYTDECLMDDNVNIIERQPLFFVVIIPYPYLRHSFYNPLLSSRSENAANPMPFYRKNIDCNKVKGRLSNHQLKLDLSGEIIIDNYLTTVGYYNDFFDKNDLPLFIDNHDELVTIINDLDNFYYKIMGFNLKLENLFKIIIPFFELNPNECLNVSNTQFSFNQF